MSSLANVSGLLADLRKDGVPFFKILPNFKMTCRDTVQNRARVIDEVANLYGFFLTKVAHEPEMNQFLRKKLSINIATKGNPLEKEAIERFVNAMKNVIRKALEEPRVPPRAHVGFDPNRYRQYLLSDALDEVSISGVGPSFPISGATDIVIRDGMIEVEVTFRKRERKAN